jgi:hypothetical protein
VCVVCVVCVCACVYRGGGGLGGGVGGGGGPRLADGMVKLKFMLQILFCFTLIIDLSMCQIQTQFPY